MSANDRQVGGEHYSKHGGLQHWDVVRHFDLDYFQGQITKYVMRWKDKGGVQDLKKAAHFLEKYIEVAARGGAPGTTTEAPQADSAKRGAVPPTAGMGAVQPIADQGATKIPKVHVCPYCNAILGP
jgi:hypothetical protein